MIMLEGMQYAMYVGVVSLVCDSRSHRTQEQGKPILYTSYRTVRTYPLHVNGTIYAV
jgi:hypothetical protein